MRRGPSNLEGLNATAKELLSGPKGEIPEAMLQKVYPYVKRLTGSFLRGHRASFNSDDATQEVVLRERPELR